MEFLAAASFACQLASLCDVMKSSNMLQPIKKCLPYITMIMNHCYINAILRTKVPSIVRRAPYGKTIATQLKMFLLLFKTE